jgi:hypothetical protein
MDIRIILIFFLLAIAGSFFGTFFIVTYIQHGKAKDLIKKLSSENLIHTRIRFYQMHQFLFTTKGGFPIKAELYFNENLILICPKTGCWFNSLFNFNLPVLFTSDRDRIGKLIGYNDVVKPDRIKLTKWKDLIIDYQGYNITIEFLVKLDKDRIHIYKGIYPIND